MSQSRHIAFSLFDVLGAGKFFNFWRAFSQREKVISKLHRTFDILTLTKSVNLPYTFTVTTIINQ